MTITLNGKSHEIEANSPTITEFVGTLPIGNQPVLVELNGEAILVREFDEHRIQEGDTLEVIRMVAGG
ncbi:MAG: sulfur carrier protein ThiS [Verrucomicrobiales bacterium]|nr:sulfur carrier protein ThiS [Verrucomicrobiales bacterium]